MGLNSSDWGFSQCILHHDRVEGSAQTARQLHGHNTYLRESMCIISTELWLSPPTSTSLCAAFVVHDDRAHSAQVAGGWTPFAKSRS